VATTDAAFIVPEIEADDAEILLRPDKLVDVFPKPIDVEPIVMVDADSPDTNTNPAELAYFTDALVLFHAELCVYVDAELYAFKDAELTYD